MKNIGKLMKQAQKMQEQMQQTIAALEVEGSAGGGMVSVKMNGSKEIVDLTIESEVVDPEDIDMLQDLVIAAINDANRKIDEEIQNQMGGLTAGLPPGLL